MKKISKSLIKNSKTCQPSLHKGFLEPTNSWFSIRNKCISRKVEPEKQINSTNIRCEKVILHPTNKQRHILLTWLELSRITYNMTLKELKKDTERLSKTKMRNKVKQKMRNNRYLYGLQKKCGIYQQTLDLAVFDVYKARKTAFSNLRNRNIKFFRMRYKKQNHHLKTMAFNYKAAFNSMGTGFKRPGLQNLRPDKPINPTKDTRLGYNTRTKQFTLFIPYDKQTKKTVNRNRICALDPGIRTFQTGYAPSGQTFQIGDENNIIRKNIDRINNAKKPVNKNWKKYINRLREKLKNRIADMHWKTVNFLCNNYETILVGNMSTKGITSNDLHLHSSTKQMAYALSHFMFKERLKSKAIEYDCEFKEVDESYTSKTCGGCGEINDQLGSSKKFECPQPQCYYRMDRDIHGARNIYIKHS
jgi:putative transposase